MHRSGRTTSSVRRPRTLLAAATVTIALVLTTGTAHAWHVEPTADFVCVVDAEGQFHVGMRWAVSSWNPGDPSGENPNIVVEMSSDGVTFTPLGTGAFALATGYAFGGAITLAEGTASVTIKAFADAPWGDGTVEPGTSVAVFDVPTLEQIGDPACETDVSPRTEEPTPTPSPTPQPEPTATPTPQEEPTATPEATPAPPATPEPAPTATPEAEVLPRVLARTGIGSGAVIIFGLALVCGGALLLGVEHRRHHRATREGA